MQKLEVAYEIFTAEVAIGHQDFLLIVLHYFFLELFIIEGFHG
jgi:hypothetical protein